MNKSIDIDWTECPLVERVAGKMGGRPVIKGTRIEPKTIISYAEHGYTAEETQAEYHTLSIEKIRALRAFASLHQAVA